MPASSPTRATSRGGQVEPDPERLEHVGRPRLAGGRAVPVLDDRRPGPGRDDGRHGGDVHRHRPVAAGADHVEDAPGDHERGGVPVHRLDEPLELVDRLALAAQRDREPGDLRRRRLAGEDLAHGPCRLVGRQVARAPPGPSSTSGQEWLVTRPPRCGVWAGRTAAGQAGTRDDSSRITASASCTGSIGCGTAASARDQVASQAS